jgi:hypothetical protein
MGKHSEPFLKEFTFCTSGTLKSKTASDDSSEFATHFYPLLLTEHTVQIVLGYCRYIAFS